MKQSSCVMEIRKYYLGKGVLNAVQNVNKVIAEEVNGMYVTDQNDIDQKMIDLDGTANKGKLGANAILGVSLAVAHAGCPGNKPASVPLYRWRVGKYAPHSHDEHS